VSGLDIERVRAEFPGRRIDYYETIDSTMRAAAGLDVGGVVLAEEQTAGQGRLGRAWHSEAGAGIYCSIALRTAPALTLALGLAAQSAIFEATGLMCDIRWPNDLMLSGKKVAGILVQVADGKAVGGIGINVGHWAFPAELAAVATSLRLELLKAEEDRPQKTMVCPNDVVIALVRAVDSFAGLEKDEVLRLFAQSSSYARGRRVRVEQADGAIEGITAGLDASGFLIVRKDDGTDTLVLAGGVRAAGS
jgi:BirA family biotin operon repressor/biotin-[acetyl-CoA-carboxylase] ligase